MNFEGSLALKGVKIDGEIRFLHLIDQGFPKVFVGCMKDDLVSRYVSGSEKRNALDMIVMKMRKKDVEGFAGCRTAVHEFLAQNPESGTSVEDQVILRAGFEVYAGRVSPKGG